MQIPISSRPYKLKILLSSRSHVLVGKGKSKKKSSYDLSRLAWPAYYRMNHPGSKPTPPVAKMAVARLACFLCRDKTESARTKAY